MRRLILTCAFQPHNVYEGDGWLVTRRKGGADAFSQHHIQLGCKKETVEQHVADGDTREHENSAKARARNILQGAKPGQATASTEGESARLGFDALGTQKPVPVSRRTGFANQAVTAIFKRGAFSVSGHNFERLEEKTAGPRQNRAWPCATWSRRDPQRAPAKFNQ